ncbi:MAG: DUF2752 domain-containing protein [Planctomycetota bacterium]
MSFAETAHISRKAGVKSAGDRVIAFTVLILCAGTIVVAACLTPAPNGYGTHTRLHLPPCAFRETTGLPCPSCGLTTSMAYMARFQFGRAFFANPFGCVGFPVVVFIGILGAFSLVSGASFSRIMERFFGLKVLYGLALLLILSWGFTLLTTLLKR